MRIKQSFKRPECPVITGWYKGTIVGRRQGADAARQIRFQLEDHWFTAMESAQDHRFDFNEAVSLMVRCETQEDIDYYWKRLSAVPEAEQCGWLKDRYGVSWQVVPEDMDRMMQEGTPEQVDRVTKAFLPMKKFDLAEFIPSTTGTVNAPSLSYLKRLKMKGLS